MLFPYTRHIFSRQLIYSAGNFSLKILGRAANFWTLVNYFAVIRRKGSRQTYLCRDALICRVFWFHFAVLYSLPCALRLLCRAFFICRDLPVACTAKFSTLPFSENLRHTPNSRPHGKFNFSGSERCSGAQRPLAMISSLSHQTPYSFCSY